MPNKRLTHLEKDAPINDPHTENAQETALVQKTRISRNDQRQKKQSINVSETFFSIHNKSLHT